MRGFTMARVGGFKPIHLLYSTASRRKEFPTADWAFLVQTALNCAGVFEELHAAGHLVGDVNESNLLVSPKDATVRLIDCDSFQIRAGGQVFRCEVGVPLFTPPELQGQSFAGLERTASHEGFSLAVLLFHLLFLGRHPFTGVFTGQGEMTPERAIREFRFAYGRNARALQMAPPAIHLPLSTLPAELTALFEQAFAPDASRTGRPTATAWYQALQNLARAALRTCPRAHAPLSAAPGGLPVVRDDGHPRSGLLHPAAPRLSRAPGLHVRPAGHRAAVARGAAAAVGKPGHARAAHVDVPPAHRAAGGSPGGSGPGAPGEPGHVRGRRAGHGGLVGAAAGVLEAGQLVLVPACTLLASASWLWWRGRRSLRLPALAAEQQRLLQQVEPALSAAQAEYERFKEELNRLAERARQLLHGLRAEYGRLQPDYEEEQRRQLQHRETLQREQFLRNALIEDHELKGIAQGLKSSLVRYGIESAYDVLKEDVTKVPGFGAVRSAKLVAWAKEVEKGFGSNPSLAVSEAERRALISHFLQRKAALRSRLEAEVAPLRTWSQEMVKRSGELAAKVEGAQQLKTKATLWMPVAPSVVEAALKPPAWEDRRYVLGLMVAVVLGGLLGVVMRFTGMAEPEHVAPPPVALEQEAPE